MLAQIRGMYWKEVAVVKAEVEHRLRNKAKLTAKDLVDPRNTDLRATLQRAEFAMTAGDDVVNGDDEDEGPTGSASDSD